jgi:plastocyanin
MRLAAVALAALALAVPSRTPARLGVTAREFGFTLSRLSVKQGPIVIELQNFGEDVHDLRLQRVGGTRTYALPETRSGDHTELEARLAPGRYRIWCAVGDHAERGMTATLVVRR